jgi:NADH-quinone oxidoreductase subunit J
MAEEIFFYVFALGAVASSVGVIALRNPVNSAISLVTSFFFLAGIYILLQAEFLAVVQVMVYAGAIMVLFLFVLMLLNLREDELGRPKLNLTKVLGVGAASLLFVVLATSVLADSMATTQLFGPSLDSTFGTVAPLGQILLTKYVLPFEMAAVLLLVGIVGAVVVAKRRL